MKHDAIVEQGIPIHERVPIPDEMIPEDSRVEIDAKIQAGYCKSFPSSRTVRLHLITKLVLTPNLQSQLGML
jgi:hypothetical protein